MIPITIQESTMLPNGSSFQVGARPIASAVMGERVIGDAVELPQQFDRQSCGGIA
jgi:hypothetical protein